MGVWKKQKTFRITRELMRLLQKEHLLIFQSTLPDPRSRAQVTAIARFQSTLPERGETLLPFSPARRGEVFQSTLPAWGETESCYLRPLLQRISIHSPRMGRDGRSSHRPIWTSAFQSTLPAWGETRKHIFKNYYQDISIHSPRMGRDVKEQDRGLGLEISIHSPRMGRDGKPSPSRQRG